MGLTSSVYGLSLTRRRLISTSRRSLNFALSVFWSCNTVWIASTSTEPKIAGVHSIKVLREAKMNASINEPLPTPPTKKVTFKPHQPENQGEKPYELEPYLNEDSLMMRINENKNQSSSIRSTHQQIGAALNNIVAGNKQQGLKTEEYGADISARNVLNERRNLKSLKRKAELQVGDEVKIKTIRFGTQYARGLPEYTYGKIITTK